jgi:hypothetical protein
MGVDERWGLGISTAVGVTMVTDQEGFTSLGRALDSEGDAER